MKTAVTAANGKLGRAVIEELVRETGKEKIVGTARNPEKAGLPGIEVRKGDYDRYDDLVAAFQGVDSVLLISGMDRPEKRIEQHRNVILAAAASGVTKIVYTSIIGDEQGKAFGPVVQSNRRTEKLVEDSGLDWVIGRNGLYIEPDLEYIDEYVAQGGISNSAGTGRCAYTSRSELAYAYARLLLDDRHKGKTYHLAGESITQEQLAAYINEVYHTKLVYRPLKVEQFLKERKEALGAFLGTVIGGIYEGISKGAFDVESDFLQAAGRQHRSPVEMIREYKS